jgi:hypothetical protein
MPFYKHTTHHLFDRSTNDPLLESTIGLICTHLDASFSFAFLCPWAF